jgi:hypothetical protein
MRAMRRIVAASRKERMDLLRRVQEAIERCATADVTEQSRRSEGGRIVKAGNSQLPSAPPEKSLDPELSLYRDYTVGMLRRYFRMSIELGRLPSILGREFFRAKVTSYRMNSFEDVVILVHDVEKCISLLDPFSQQLIARVVLEEHTHEEAALVMRCARKTVSRLMPEALDQLSEIFLRKGILRRLGNPKQEEATGEKEEHQSEKKSPDSACQGGESDELGATA